MPNQGVKKGNSTVDWSTTVSSIVQSPEGEDQIKMLLAARISSGVCAASRLIGDSVTHADIVSLKIQATGFILRLFNSQPHIALSRIYLTPTERI